MTALFDVFHFCSNGNATVTSIIYYHQHNNLADNEKTKWRKKGFDCWNMGLRLIGTKAFWDPVIFTEWLFTNCIKNKPTNLMERTENKALITFVRKKTKYEDQ